MTAINRTAYPRLDARLNHEELAARYIQWLHGLTVK
jgi:hypothetical protein